VIRSKWRIPQPYGGAPEPTRVIISNRRRNQFGRGLEANPFQQRIQFNE
jgi:hypothetical protein